MLLKISAILLLFGKSREASWGFGKDIQVGLTGTLEEMQGGEEVQQWRYFNLKI